ncbi:MAG TPA: CDP-diacylglycerol--serine O-phosphatidyltransferase [Gammaproteobacteria bacterium]|jgi:CDP-diacylglycerol--serine O-phosphatidyltransferase|nr:CDP-diacylglycerol--serine O-phosphatidyltransferase [Gammaproteobacteria bacterium]
MDVSDQADDEQVNGETEKVSPRRRGIYLAPNLITTGALFAGFYAIVAGMNGNFVAAALAIYVAMLLDTLDGRVARWTRTESRFGAEYDSLSDMVAFGVAPALVAFSWGLDTLGKVGWFCTFVYMACAALRLARFNTQSELASFTGLASPSAAAIIASAVWVSSEGMENAEPSFLAALLIGILTLLVGLLMVSSFRYFSPKGIDLKDRVPFITLVFIALVLAIMVADPPRVLLVLSLLYAASGPVTFLWRRRRRAVRQGGGA